MSNVQVVARLRPLNKRELNSGSNADIPVVTTNTENNTVTVVKGLGNKAVRSRFQVSKVYNSFATQEDVFGSVRGLVDDVLEGYDATVFAFGQTGTGKTYTMEGDIASEEHMGVIPRACRQVFDTLADERFTKSSVSVSYLEIYNEQLCDLLAERSDEDNNTKALRICTTSRQNGSRVTCMGLSSRKVDSPAAILNIIDEAREKRQVAETKMNKQSSRSHVIFTISVCSSELIDDATIERSSKLHLVDLAGSECAKSTGSSRGVRMQESKNINKSLLTLGRVISSLRNQSGRIPYRDSKLTRLLQEALGGRSKTLIVATLSPSIISMEESLSTMAYAEKAHGIVNKKVEARARMAVNSGASSMSDNGSGENQVGTASRSTFAEMEARLNYMTSQCREAQAALAKKHLEVAAIMERAESAETSVANLTENLEHVSGLAATQKEKIEELTLTLSERNAVLHVRRETEQKLTKEALSLIKTLGQSVIYSKSLHKKLSDAHKRDREVRKASNETRGKLETSAAALGVEAESFISTHSENLSLLQRNVSNGMSTFQEQAGVLHKNITVITEKLLTEHDATKNDVALATKSISTEGQSSLNALFEEKSAIIKATKDATSTFSDIGNNWKESILKSQSTLSKWGEKSTERMTAIITKLKDDKERVHSLNNDQAKARSEQIQELLTSLNAQKSRIESLASALDAQSKNLLIHEQAISAATGEISAASEDMIAGLITQGKRLESAIESTEQVCTSLAGVSSENEENASSHLASINNLATSNEKYMTELLSTCEAQRKQTEEAVLKLKTARDDGASKISAVLSSLQANQVEEFTNAQLESFSAQKDHIVSASKSHSVGLAQAQKMKNCFSKMIDDTTSAFDSHSKSALGLSKTLSEASTSHKSKATAISSQQNSLISSANESCNSKGARTQSSLVAISDALTDAKNLHATAENRIRNQQHDELETMQVAVNNQMSVIVPETLSSQNEILKRLLKEQASGQAAIISSTMAAVQEMLTSKMAELQSSLTSEVELMRERNATLLSAANTTSSVVEKGKDAVISFVNESKAEGEKVQKAADAAIEAVQNTNTTVGKLMSEVSTDLKHVQSAVIARDNADLALAESIGGTCESLSGKLYPDLEESKTYIHKTIKSSLLKSTDKWIKSCENASEMMEFASEMNQSMSEHHTNCISATRESIASIQESVNSWSTCNENSCKEFTDVTLGCHNSSLQKGISVAGESLKSHINILTRETEEAVKVCKLTKDKLLDISSENSTQQSIMEKNSSMHANAMSNLKSQTTSMSSSDVPGMSETVTELTESNSSMHKVMIPSIKKADQERLDLQQEHLENMYTERTASVNLELTSAAQIMKAHKEDTKAHIYANVEAIASKAEGHLKSIQHILEAQKIRADESWTLVSGLNSKIQTRMKQTSAEIKEISDNIDALTSSHVDSVSQTVDETDSSCKNVSAKVANLVQTFGTGVKESTKESASEIGTLCSEIIESENDPEKLAPLTNFPFSKALTSTPDEACIIESISLPEASSTEKVTQSPRDTMPAPDPTESTQTVGEQTVAVSTLDCDAEIPPAPEVSEARINSPAKNASAGKPKIQRSALSSIDNNTKHVESGEGEKAKKTFRTGLRRPKKIKH